MKVTYNDYWNLFSTTFRIYLLAFMYILYLQLPYFFLKLQAVECKYPVGQRVEWSKLRPVGVADTFASSKKCWVLFCNFSPSCPHHHSYDLFSKLEQAQCNSFLSGLTGCTGKAGEPGGDRMVFGISELESSLTWTTYQREAVGKLFPHVTPVFCRMGETVFPYSC